MKINIDLNKLTLEELNQFLKLAEKSKGEENDKEVAPRVEQKVIVVQKKKRKKRRVQTGGGSKGYGKNYWEDCFVQVQELIEKGAYKTPAIKKVIGYTTGKIGKAFNRWQRKHQGKDKRSARAKFIFEKVNQYINLGMDRTNAFKKANVDYNEQMKPKKKGEYMIKPKAKVPESPTEARLRLASQMAKPKVVLSFPRFHTVQEVYQPILQSVVRNMLELEGTKITYLSEGILLDIAKDDWKEFLGEFFANSNDIALFFKVPNNFKIKYSEIHYLK